ncbi:hypothetical protein JCM5350_000308 [Sporobolomyces pararoseus]
MASDALPTVRPHPPGWQPPTPDRDGLELPRNHIERLTIAAQNPKRDLPPINRRVLKFNSVGSHSSDDSEEVVFEQIHPAEYIDESPKDRKRLVLALTRFLLVLAHKLAIASGEMLDKSSGMDIPAVRKRLEGILYAEKHLKEKLSIEKQSLLQHPPRTLDEMTQSTAKLQKIGKQVEGLARDIETLEYVFVVFRKLDDRLKRHGNGASVLDRALIISHAPNLRMGESEFQPVSRRRGDVSPYTLNPST